MSQSLLSMQTPVFRVAIVFRACIISTAPAVGHCHTCKIFQCPPAPDCVTSGKQDDRGRVGNHPSPQPGRSHPFRNSSCAGYGKGRTATGASPAKICSRRRATVRCDRRRGRGPDRDLRVGTSRTAARPLADAWPSVANARFHKGASSSPLRRLFAYRERRAVSIRHELNVAVRLDPPRAR